MKKLTPEQLADQDKQTRDWCFPFFHDWGKWEEYKPLITMVIQKRSCKKCNLFQFNSIDIDI